MERLSHFIFQESKAGALAGFRNVLFVYRKKALIKSCLFSLISGESFTRKEKEYDFSSEAHCLF